MATYSSSDKSVKRVAVLAGSSLTWREELMRGIAGFSHEQGQWHVYTAPEGVEDSVFFSARYRWDGLIVRPPTLRFVRQVMKLGIPAVSIGSLRVKDLTLPRVKIDDIALAQTAGKHLISCGLRRFAYCGFMSKNAEDRGASFSDFLRGEHFKCAHYSDFAKDLASGNWIKRQRDLVRWVRQLEKPVGILAWNPDVACQLIEACHLAEIAVPGEVAVIAAGEDRMKCELASPTISAIDFPAARIGYLAASLLSRMIGGGAPPDVPLLIAPSGVVIARQSTMTTGMADREVHEIAQYIREHARDNIDINSVARKLNLSRSWLERHFRRVLGHTPQQELRSARLDHARRLLLDTDWPAVRIATASGFSSAAYFNVAFKHDMKLSPLQFRIRHRLRA